MMCPNADDVDESAAVETATNLPTDSARRADSLMSIFAFITIICAIVLVVILLSRFRIVLCLLTMALTVGGMLILWKRDRKQQ